MKDTSILDLNKTCFIHCLCHLEFGVPQQLNEVATRAGNGTHATDSS